MTAAENNTPGEIPADRGIPSIAVPPKNPHLWAAVFAIFGIGAIIYVLVLGMHKDAAKDLTTPKEVTFKSPPGTVPYIAADSPATAAPSQNTDALAVQKELALQQEALRMAVEQQKKLEQRLRSPLIVYDQSGAATALPSAAPVNTQASLAGNSGIVMGAGGSAPSEPGVVDDSNAAFASQNADKSVETAQASQMQNLHTLIPQGTLIAGILETAIQSDLPGMVRAIVSENIYSFDGTHLLIPQGTRLIGQYRSGLVRGQSRVFVIWNRLIRNDGVSINIGSYGTDDLGRSGLNGDVDTHFFERFGSSVLLSMIDSGLQIGAESVNSKASATVAVNTGNDFSKSAEIALQNSIAIPPTVNVDQGTRIKVFVGKDLDFSRVAGNKLAEEP